MTASRQLRSLVVRGIAWKALSQAAVQLFRVATAIVLARLLTPEDYGLAGMVLVFSTFLYAFSDLGLGAALVQRRELSERDRSTAFWLTAGAGLVLCGLGVAASGLVAAFYDEPDLQPLFVGLSITALLTALGSTQVALLTREMRFRALELRIILSTLVGAAGGIALAVAGYGPWAIVGQALIAAAVSTVLLWIVSPWRPRFLVSRSSLRDIGGFGTRVLGANLFFSLNRNVDNLLVGKFLGASPLGLYALAYNVMLVPLSRLSAPVQEVLFPALSKTQDDLERSRMIVLRVTRVVAAITMPLMLGLIVVAPDFVVAVLGERWREATPVIRILAWVGLLQSLTSLNHRVLTAQGQTRRLFVFAAASFGVYLVAWLVGLRFGVVGVATAYAIAATLIVQPASALLTLRCIELPVRRLAAALGGVVQASLVAVTVVAWTRWLLVEEGASPGFRLAVAVGVGLVAYLVTLPVCARELLTDLLGMRRRPGIAAHEALDERSVRSGSR